MQKTASTSSELLVTFLFFSLIEFLLCNNVRQHPVDILCHPDDEKEISCSHNVKTYDTILWYQQKESDTAMELIGRVYFKDKQVEEPWKKNFSVSGDGEKDSSLHVLSAKPALSAVYFCAAYYTQPFKSPSQFVKNAR